MHLPLVPQTGCPLEGKVCQDPRFYLLLLLLCQFMEDRSAQGKRRGMRGGPGRGRDSHFSVVRTSLLAATLLSEDEQIDLATPGRRAVGDWRQ